MKRTPQLSGDRLPLVITLGTFVVLLACLPVALRLDQGVDSDRPMYHDMELMLGLQAAYVATGQPPVEVQLSDEQPVMIGATEFTPSPGVSLDVRVTDDSLICVTASNQQGTTAERCND